MRFVLLTLLLTACAGPKGDIGPQGPQGDVGPIGSSGPQGPQGDSGPAGMGIVMICPKENLYAICSYDILFIVKNGFFQPLKASGHTPCEYNTNGCAVIRD